MNISVKFNRFYHNAVLNDIFKKAHRLVFTDLKDTRTGGAFTLYKYEDYSCLDELKQLLKILNLNYGVDVKKDCKVSTKNIEVKQLLIHIEWVIELSIKNGIELKFVTDEWDRLIQMYNR